MSWLFGRKKQQKDSPPSESAEEEPSEPSEGFVIINKGPAPSPPSMAQDESMYPSLYPHVPPVVPSNLPKDQAQGDATHYLSGVPFKLCKQLERSMNSDLDIDRLRIDEMLSFIERIENQNYDYSFSAEEGVIAEMNSRSNE